MAISEHEARWKAALSLHQAGRIAEAGDAYRAILKDNPNDALALQHLGALEARHGRFDQASSLMARSVAIEPSNIQFIENYATILYHAGNYELAQRVCDNALGLNPANVALLYVSAIALYKLKSFEKSIAQFDQLLSLQPQHLAALNERGAVLAEMRRYDAALAAFQQVLKLAPQYAEAHLNNGNVLAKLKQFGEALVAFDNALRLKSGLADAWLGRGNVLNRLDRLEEALAAHEKAIALEPDLDSAWLGRGNVLHQLGRLDDALEAYNKALALTPDLAAAWLGRANVYYQSRRYDAALHEYDKAFALDPAADGVAGLRLMTKKQLCDWRGLDFEQADLVASLRHGTVVWPFNFITLSSSSADNLRCARLYTSGQPTFSPIWQGEIRTKPRIRVGYLSANFHRHAVAYLIAQLFELHDRSRFEVLGISFGPEDSSDMQLRLGRSFDQLHQVRRKSDDDVAKLLYELRVDIAVDLMGYTLDARPGILARRPAPIQVNYLGYPGTMGADHIDYILADPTIIPEEECGFYTEQVIWLDGSYQINDRHRKISEHGLSRSECDLPGEAFVFCCFNNCYKVTPELFDVWMRLLKSTERSVLWLFEANSTAAANLKREAENRGISPQRLIFAPKLEMSEHLARHRHADLFLDTLPYNAHTTASDALWAGVPVLTCLGSTFPGRVAASLLRAVGLDELITHSLEDYEALAAKLAHDASYLASVKNRLSAAKNVAPLFDSPRTARNIEAAFTMMWERHQHGESPKDSGKSRPIRV